jgi:hypothetical protein
MSQTAPVVLPRAVFEIDSVSNESYSLSFQQLALFVQSTRIAAELAIGANNPVAGDLGRVGIAIEGVTNRAKSARSQTLGQRGIGGDSARRDLGRQSPDTLIERHFLIQPPGPNLSFQLVHKILHEKFRFLNSL